MNQPVNIDRFVDDAIALADINGSQTGTAPAPRRPQATRPADSPRPLWGAEDDDRRKLAAFCEGLGWSVPTYVTMDDLQLPYYEATSLATVRGSSTTVYAPEENLMIVLAKRFLSDRQASNVMSRHASDLRELALRHGKRPDGTWDEAAWLAEEARNGFVEAQAECRRQRQKLFAFGRRILRYRPVTTFGLQVLKDIELYVFMHDGRRATH